MRPAVSEQRPGLRRLLAAIIALDLLFFLYIFGEDRQIGAGHGALNAFNDAVSGLPGSIALVVVGLIAAAAFARRAGRLWEGLAALLVLAVLNTAHAQLFGSPWRHLFFSGVCLAGWLVGLAVSRARGMPEDESYARMGSIALLGAAYLSAGLSKLSFGGPDWLAGLPIRAAIVAQDGLVPDSLISLYRGWIVDTPLAAGAFATATVGFELAGPLMILGWRTRAFVALGLFAMHFNIFVLMPILYWESMVLLLAFGLSRDGPSLAAETADASPTPHARAYYGAALLLALCAAAGVAYQAVRHVRLLAAEHVVATPNPTATVPAPWRAQIGPFAAGQAVAEGWKIEALELRDDEFVVTVDDGRGPARFTFSCAPSEFQSPFDLGPAHIFYSKDRAFDDVSAPGRALQATVRTAAGGRDVCAVFGEWRAAARRP